MAKKEQLDFGQIEVDGDMDFDSWEDSFMQEPQPKKERGVILEVAAGLAEGVIDEVTNAGNVVKFMRNSLPEGYGEAWDAVDKVSGSVVDLYDTAVKELKPGLGVIADKVDRLVPEDSKIAKSVTSKLKSWFGSDYKNYSEDAKSRQDKAVADMVQGVFATQMQQQEKQHLESSAEAKVEKAIDNKRFDISANILSRIESSTKQTAAYTTTFNMQFQKKSLELQYRSYLTTVDLLQHFQKSSEVSKQQLEAVVKNTAMPEFVKLRTSERLHEIARDKLIGKAGAMFGSSDRLGQGLKTVKNNFKDLISSVKQGVEAGIMGADALQMVIDMEQQMAEANGEAGPNWFKKTGLMAGGMGAGWVMNKASDALRESSLDEEAIVKGGLTARNYARSPDMAMNKILELPYFDDDRFNYGSPAHTLQQMFKNQLLSFGEKKPGATFSIHQGVDGANLNDPAINDQHLRKIQIDVVPGYLARILREVTVANNGDPKTPLLKYDVIGGKFKTQTEMVKDIQETTKKQIQSGNFNRARASAVRSMAKDDITDQESSEVQAIVGKIGVSEDLLNRDRYLKNFTKDINILRETSEYKALTDREKALFEKHIMSGMEGDSVEAAKKISEMAGYIKDMRTGREDILTSFKQLVAAGQSEELVESGLAKAEADGKSASVDMEAYNKYLHEPPPPGGSDVNIKEKIKPTNRKGVLESIRDRAVSAFGADPQPNGTVTSDVNAKEEVTALESQDKSTISKQIKKKLGKASRVIRQLFGGGKEERLATSDANAKEEVQPAKSKGILDRMRGIKIFNWQYKQGKESQASKEVGGGEQTHTGPMAQTVNAKLGADAAPGGTKLDLISMNGYSMAAIQELADRVDSIVKEVPFLKNILAKKAGKKEEIPPPVAEDTGQQQLGLDLGEPQPAQPAKKEGWGTRALNTLTGAFTPKDSTISSQTTQPQQPQVASDGQISLGLEEVNQDIVEKLKRKESVNSLRNAVVDLVTPKPKESVPQDTGQQVLFEELKDSNELKQEQTSVLGKIFNWLTQNTPKQEQATQAETIQAQEAVEKKNREGLTELDYLKAITENTDSLIELANSGKGIITKGQDGNFAGVRTGNAYVDGFTQLAQLGLGLIGKGAYDAGTGAIKAGTTTAQATGKFLDKHKESIKDAGKWVFDSIADLTIKGLELGKKTLLDYVPKGIKSLKDVGKKLGKMFEKLLNGAEDLYIAGRDSPVILATLMRAGHYRDSVTNKVIETLDDLQQVQGNVLNAAGEVVITAEDIAKGLYNKHGIRIKTLGKKLGSLAWAGASWAAKKVANGAMSLFDKAKNSDFKIPGLDWVKGKLSDVKDSITGLGFYDRRSYDVLVQIRDLLTIGKPKKLVQSILSRQPGQTPTKDFKATDEKEKQIDKQNTEKFEKKLEEVEGTESGEIDLKDKWSEFTGSLKDLLGIKTEGGSDTAGKDAGKESSLLPQTGDGPLGKFLDMLDPKEGPSLKERALGLRDRFKDAWTGKKAEPAGAQMDLFAQESPPAEQKPKGKLAQFFNKMGQAWSGNKVSPTPPAPADNQMSLFEEQPAVPAQEPKSQIPVPTEKPKGRLSRLLDVGRKYLAGDKQGAKPAERVQDQKDMFSEPAPVPDANPPEQIGMFDAPQPEQQVAPVQKKPTGLKQALKDLAGKAVEKLRDPKALKAQIQEADIPGKAKNLVTAAKDELVDRFGPKQNEMNFGDGTPGFLDGIKQKLHDAKLWGEKKLAPVTSSTFYKENVAPDIKATKDDFNKAIAVTKGAATELKEKLEEKIKNSTLAQKAIGKAKEVTQDTKELALEKFKDTKESVKKHSKKAITALSDKTKELKEKAEDYADRFSKTELGKTITAARGRTLEENKHLAKSFIEQKADTYKTKAKDTLMAQLEKHPRLKEVVMSKLDPAQGQLGLDGSVPTVMDRVKHVGTKAAGLVQEKAGWVADTTVGKAAGSILAKGRTKLREQARKIRESGVWDEIQELERTDSAKIEDKQIGRAHV